jgi:sulfhydrogenase subunit beta (sulfur reductase)
MTKKQLSQFISFLNTSGNRVYAPVKKDSSDLLISRIANPEEVVLNGQVTKYSWRKFFLPATETMFNIHGRVLKKIKVARPQILLGLTILDLRAIDLYNQVFADDAYYQERKRATIVIGQPLAPAEQREFAEYQVGFKEDHLEHVEFDIFLDKSGDNFKVYTGSEDGQRLLEKFGFKDYENIKYVGPIREEGKDPEMLALKDLLPASRSGKLWRELGEICLACGQCSLVCPTCYCFNITDKAKVKSDEGRRVREWTTCFYPDFSRIAGPHRFLNSSEARIYYWYEHKFVRDPQRYHVPGCVRCGRCVKACPVDINIFKNLQRLKQAK